MCAQAATEAGLKNMVGGLGLASLLFYSIALE